MAWFGRGVTRGAASNCSFAVAGNSKSAREFVDSDSLAAAYLTVHKASRYSIRGCSGWGWRRAGHCGSSWLASSGER